MIALDTNVLVRFFTQDDPVQCRQTDEVMRSLSSSNPAWIGLAVLIELEWTLSRTYKVEHASVLRALEDLLDRPEFRIEQIDTVMEALRAFRNGKAEFADCVIAASARSAGCSRTFTFDRIAARDAGMELIE